MNKISYSGYRFPPEIIHRAIWLYLRFTRIGCGRGRRPLSACARPQGPPKDGGNLRSHASRRTLRRSSVGIVSFSSVSVPMLGNWSGPGAGRGAFYSSERFRWPRCVRVGVLAASFTSCELDLLRMSLMSHTRTIHSEHTLKITNETLSGAPRATQISINRSAAASRSVACRSANSSSLLISLVGIDKLIESSENLPSVAMSLVGANS